MGGGGSPQHHLSPALRQLLLGLPGKLGHKLPQVGGGEHQGQIARLHAGKVEEPLEQPLHVAGLAVGHIQILFPLLRGVGHPVPHPLDVALHRGEGGTQVVGDAGHQIGAGLFIAGALLPLLAQVLLHVVEGGADGGKLVLAPVAHRGGQVPLLHPPGRLGQGVHRAHNPPDLGAGQQQAQQYNHPDGHKAADEQGENDRLRLGSGTPQHLGHHRLGHGNEGHASAPAAHHHQPLVLEDQRALLRPGGPAGETAVGLLLGLVQRGVEGPPVPLHQQLIALPVQLLVQRPPVAVRLRPLAQNLLGLGGAVIRRGHRPLLVEPGHPLDHKTAHGQQQHQRQHQRDRIKKKYAPSHPHHLLFSVNDTCKRSGMQI